jgi:D-alanyl-D-alanine carboxypeptidase
VNRAVVRSLAALVAVALAVGGCFGSTPAASGPVDHVAITIPSLAASASADPRPGGTPGPSTGTAPASQSPATSSPATVLPGAAPTFAPWPPGGRRDRGSASATPLLRAVLDARLAALRARYGIPGVSVAIVFADGSTWHGESGLADVAAGRSVTSDTAFSIASVSKTFTAALILALVDDGRLSLESSAKTYLPDVAIDPSITVRELLDHTSGLRDFYFHPRIDKALLTRPARVWDATRSLSFVGKPYAKPGTSWHYSNTNYLVLGLLAEAVGRAPVAEQLRDRFFAPLGLDHTWYQAVEKPRGPVARGYRFTGAKPGLPAIDLSDGSSVVPFTSVVTASGAAGSVASTAGDLARWVKALYGGGALDPGSRDAMVADILRTASYQPSTGYGLGVQAVTVDGHATLGHSGRFLGSRAVARWLTHERIAIAVTTNQSRTDPNLVLADLLALALQPQADCLTCPAVP